MKNLISLLIVFFSLSTWAAFDELTCMQVYQAINSGNDSALESVLKSDPECISFNWKGYTPLTFAIDKKNIEAVKTLTRLKADPTVRDGLDRVPLQFSIDKKFFEATSIMALNAPKFLVKYNDLQMSLLDLGLKIKNDTLVVAVIESVNGPEVLQQLYAGKDILIYRFIDDLSILPLRALVKRWPNELKHESTWFNQWGNEKIYPIHYAYYLVKNPSWDIINVLKSAGASINDPSKSTNLVFGSAINLGWISDINYSYIFTDLVIDPKSQIQLEEVTKGRFIFWAVGWRASFEYFYNRGFDLSYQRALRFKSQDKSEIPSCFLFPYVNDDELWKRIMFDLGWRQGMSNCRENPDWIAKGRFPLDLAHYQQLVAADLNFPKPRCKELLGYFYSESAPPFISLINEIEPNDFDSNELRECIFNHFKLTEYWVQHPATKYPLKLSDQTVIEWLIIAPFLKKDGALNAWAPQIFQFSRENCFGDVAKMLRYLGFVAQFPITMDGCAWPNPSQDDYEYSLLNLKSQYGEDYANAARLYFYFPYILNRDMRVEGKLIHDPKGQEMYWAQQDADTACRSVVNLAKISNTLLSDPDRFKRFTTTFGGSDIKFSEFIARGINDSKAAQSTGACDLLDKDTFDLILTSQFYYGKDGYSAKDLKNWILSKRQ